MPEVRRALTPDGIDILRTCEVVNFSSLEGSIVENNALVIVKFPKSETLHLFKKRKKK